MGPTVVDSLISHEWNRFGEKFFNLPSVNTMITELLSLKENENNNNKL